MYQNMYSNFTKDLNIYTNPIEAGVESIINYEDSGS